MAIFNFNNMFINDSNCCSKVITLFKSRCYSYFWIVQTETPVDSASVRDQCLHLRFESVNDFPFRFLLTERSIDQAIALPRPVRTMKRLASIFSWLAFAFLFLASNLAAEKPNVLFLVVDDLNDYPLLGNYPNVKAPSLQQFSQKAVTFERGYCAAPICVPSRTATFSGKNPWSTGSYYNQPTTWPHEQMKGMESIPECFKRNGYKTFGAGKLFHQGPGKERMDAMWDDYSNYGGGFGPFPEESEQVIGSRFFSYKAWNGPDEDFPDVRNTDAAIAFLQSSHDRPFFLALGLYRPHCPWTAPRRFFDEYNKSRLPRPPGRIRDDLDDARPMGIEFAQVGDRLKKINDQKAYRDFLHGYLASVTFADWNVGRILDALWASPHAEDTIVVLWSDHGYHFGEKDHIGKATLWEQATRSLVMMRVPGYSADSERCEKPISLVDIYPTLVALCDLEEPPQRLDGVDLSPLLKKPARKKWKRPVVMAHGPGSVAVRDEQYRYIRYADGTEELFDHATDRYEFFNLADLAAYSKVKKKLSKHFPDRWAPEIRNEGARLW